MTFKNSDELSQCEITILERNNEFIEIELTCIIDSLGIKIENQKIKCDNIHPEATYNMDMFDPSGDFNPGEVFDGKNPFEMIRIFLPVEEVDKEIEYVGLIIVDKNSEEKDLFETVLR